VTFTWSGTRWKVPEAGYKNRKLEQDGHYWEIGYQGVSARDIERISAKIGLSLFRTWRVREKPFHRFYLYRVGAAS